MNNNKKKVYYLLPVDENKVIDYVIDTYLWLSEYLNTDEIRCLGSHLTSLADRRATDVEMAYNNVRVSEMQHIPDEGLELTCCYE